MPVFTFQGPGGEIRKIEGPDGSTKEQAFAMLQQQLAAQQPTEEKQQEPAPTAKALTPKERLQEIIGSQTNPLKTAVDEAGKPIPHPTLASAGKAIAESGAVGTVLGTAAPEILTGAGIIAGRIPGVGPAIGETLMAAGSAARADRLGSAATGLLSGLASESAGQAAEAAGASKSTADTARLVGGVATPSATALAGFVAKPVKLAWNAVNRLVNGAEESVPAAVNKAREALAKAVENGQPQHQMHAMLQQGIEADRKAAQQAADAEIQRSISEANRVAASDSATATRIINDGRTRADQIQSDAAKRASALEKASDNKLATSNRILAQAEPELAKVGQARPLSDVGNELRNAATAKQGAALQARNEQYRALQAERDAVVAAKEETGDTIDKLPEMKALKNEIGQYTLSNKAGREGAKGLAKATDPGTLRAYQQVEDAISNRRVQVGVDPETGNPKYQMFRTSFEAIDAVRRRLGEAGKGDAEGYGALGKQIANKLYSRLSKIQEAYVGEQGGRNLQREMQSGYAEATEATKGFGTAAGKKLTAVDRVDPEKFAADPQGLPKYFFSSQQSVRDAIELTGNKELVTNAANSYATSQIQGMSSKQVRSWATKNNDWTREVPGLQKKVQDYANQLEKIERVSGKLEKRADVATKAAASERTTGSKLADEELVAARKRASQAAEGSVQTQERILREGQTSAQGAKESVGGAAERLGASLKAGEAPETVRNLLLNGNQEQTRLASSYLSRTPGGQQVLEQSVRQSVRNMSEKQLSQQWQERVLPMLKEGKMLTPERIAALEMDVNRILQAYKGKDKLSLVQRHIIAAMSGAVNADKRAASGG